MTLTEPPSDIDPQRQFTRARFNSIRTDHWRALLRMYRELRIRIPYAPSGSPGLNGYRANGHSYGLSRDEARLKLSVFASELDWYTYLGSK